MWIILYQESFSIKIYFVLNLIRNTNKDMKITVLSSIKKKIYCKKYKYRSEKHDLY
jgi:hypothetical protein